MLVPPPDSIKFLTECSNLYQERLPGSPGEAYLRSRNLTYQAAASFRLGYVPEDSDPAHRKYQGCVAIPYLTAAGVINIKFRRIPDADGMVSGEKMLNLPGSSTRIYNTTLLDKPIRDIYVTEGEIDCIVANMLELPAIGFAGCGMVKSHHRYMLMYRRLTVLADGDEPGMKLATTLAEMCPGTKIVQFPEGYDVNSYFTEHGEQKFLKYVLPS